MDAKGISCFGVVAFGIGVAFFYVSDRPAVITGVLVNAKHGVGWEDLSAIQVTGGYCVSYSSLAGNRAFRFLFPQVGVFASALIVAFLSLYLFYHFLFACGFSRLDFLPAGQGFVAWCFVFGEVFRENVRWGFCNLAFGGTRLSGAFAGASVTRRFSSGPLLSYSWFKRARALFSWFSTGVAS